MNTFLSNIALNFNVPEYHEYEGISRNFSDPILKAIVKYRNHPSIKAIEGVSNSKDLLSFDVVDIEKILKEISSLDHTEVCQESDIPTKLLKKMLIFFQKFFISCLMLHSIKEPFHQFSNWLMLP